MFVAMPRGAQVGATLAIALLALATAWLVHATGGVRFATLHLMYVPVVLGALAFGATGGVLAGIAGGLLLGPWMPIDTSTGEMQRALNWGYRLTFFTLIGALVGVGAQHLRRHLQEMQWLHEHHPDTGLLNLAGLIKQLDRLMHSATDRRPVLLSITQLNNFLEIQNTFGTAFGMRVLAQVLQRAQRWRQRARCWLWCSRTAWPASPRKLWRPSCSRASASRRRARSRTWSTVCRYTSRPASASRLRRAMRRLPRSCCRRRASRCTGRRRVTRRSRATTPAMTARAATT
jgi:hypothetical protein